MSPPEAPVARPRRHRALLHAALAIAGCAALWALVQHVGARPLLATLERAAPQLPVLLALEAARLGCDALATLTLCPPRSAPRAAIVRAHVVTYPLIALMPAGRATAETVKAAILAPYVGIPRAAAIATLNQALTLLAAGAASLFAGVAAFGVSGASALTLGIAVHAGVSVAGGATLAVAARRREIGAWLARRLARVGKTAVAFQDAMREHPTIPPRALAALCANRVLQVAQFAVLLAAVGAEAGLVPALVAFGVGAVGAALGDLIPAQVGATDGAFTLAAPVLGLTASTAVALAVLGHFVQVAGAVAAAITGVFWRAPSHAAARASATPDAPGRPARSAPSAGARATPLGERAP